MSKKSSERNVQQLVKKLDRSRKLTFFVSGLGLISAGISAVGAYDYSREVRFVTFGMILLFGVVFIRGLLLFRNTNSEPNPPKSKE